MPMLLFYVGNNRYAIENRHIIKVVPRVHLKKVPYAVSYMSGLMNWGGKPIPVVDFCQLIEQRATSSVLNSRILLVQDPLYKDRWMGILGEKMTEIMDVRADQFIESGIHLHQFPYLDGVYSDNKGVIQKIDVEEFFKFVSIELFQVSRVESHGPT